MNPNKKISLAIAGTTKNTLQVSKALISSPDFSISLIITPAPKKIGRKQVLTPNPMDVFADENKINKILIDKKIDENLKNKIIEHKNIDILLVVDFGYYIPKWLLNWPKIAPLNIHPSALPNWRGSSPGQFSLLFGDKKSAVTLMIINEVLDQGDILHQDSFDVGEEWTQAKYYQHSFDLICKKLPSLISDFVEGKIDRIKQPELSPLPIARQLSKNDSFVNWDVLNLALNTNFQDFDLHNDYEFYNKINNGVKNGSILESIFQNTSQDRWPYFIFNACRAFSPWPGLWTYLPTENGQKRMKILECEITESDKDNKSKKLMLKTVQVEGKNPSSWKNQ